MANSISAEVWLEERRWDALEEVLSAQGSSIEKHLQDYLIDLYNEMVPREQWMQIEKSISDEAAKAAREVEERTVYTAFHVREHGQDQIFATTGGEEFLDVARQLRRYVRDGNTGEGQGFMRRFHTAQPITKDRFEELAALRAENCGKVAGAFEIDLDAGWLSGLRALGGWQTFKTKDISAAVYHAARSSHLPVANQWEKFLDHLQGKEIEPESFSPVEIGGLRPLRREDILCVEGPTPEGRELKFRLDLTSYGARKEVLGLTVDCSKPGNALEITCGYDAALQGMADRLMLTLRQKNGMVRKDLYYPLEAVELELLQAVAEAFCRQQTGKTLNDYYAQIDRQRGDERPALTGGSQRLPMDAVTFSDEIIENEHRMNFYIPIYFDPDAAFGTHVCTDANDDWLDVYANFDLERGKVDSTLTVCLCCTDGHTFEFSYPLTPEEQGILRDKMDTYYRQQTGQGLEERRVEFLKEQVADTPELQM